MNIKLLDTTVCVVHDGHSIFSLPATVPLLPFYQHNIVTLRISPRTIRQERVVNSPRRISSLEERRDESTFGQPVVPNTAHPDQGPCLPDERRPGLAPGVSCNSLVSTRVVVDPPWRHGAIPR